MISTPFSFVFSLILIVAGAELFTNAVEWVGYIFKLGTGATGSLLAALGTSLPETIVPIVAIAAHRPHSIAIATGAVLGSSFMLLSLGGLVTAIAVANRHSDPKLNVSPSQSRRDLGVFVVALTGSLIVIPFPYGVHIVWGCILLLGYAFYVRLTLLGGVPADIMPEPLHLTFHRQRMPHWFFVILQLVIAVIFLVIGSNIFVTQITVLARSLHINPLVLSLIVVPLATELPETLNSVLWVKSGSDGLAFGNVAGSATFQGCVLGFVAVVFTPWHPPTVGIVVALFAIVTALYMFLLLRNGSCRGKHLIAVGIPWILFVFFEIFSAVIH